MHSWMHTYVPTYPHTYTHTHILYIIYLYMYIYIHTHIPTYIPTCLHTYLPACMHTYIHTYILICRFCIDIPSRHVSFSWDITTRFASIQGLAWYSVYALWTSEVFTSGPKPPRLRRTTVFLGVSMRMAFSDKCVSLKPGCLSSWSSLKLPFEW